VMQYRKPSQVVNIEAFRIDVTTPTPAPIQRSERFYRVPQVWLDKAMAAAHPRSLHTLIVALCLYRQWMMRKKSADCIPIGNIDLARRGVSPDAKIDALRKLEAAGLIRVQHRPRKSPRVTVLPAEQSKDD
jgi:hypothetical protein